MNRPLELGNGKRVKLGLGRTVFLKDFVAYLTGYALFMAGLLFLIGGIISLFVLHQSIPLSLFFSALGLTMGIIGTRIVAKLMKKVRHRENDLIENEILRRASAGNGILTEREFYVSFWKQATCKKIIKKYLNNGTIEIKEFTPEGNVYQFPQMISDKEKENAKGIYEF